jgi:uncharacterized protein YjiS (DUF1127 family)
MNTPITSNQFGFSLGELTYIGPDFDDGPATAGVSGPKHRLGTWVASLFGKLAEWHRRRAVMYELAMLTDRELSDIGLSRYDLPHVFDPAFVAEHARGRDYIAY